MKILPYLVFSSLILVACGSEKPKSGKSQSMAQPKSEEPQQPIETPDTSSQEVDQYERERQKITAEIDNARAARQEKTVRIYGTIRGAEGMSITLDKLGGEERMVPLKTQMINADGYFELETTTQQWQIYNLRTDAGNMILLVDGGNYEVNADIKKLSEYKVNAPESYRLREFYLILEEFNKRYDKLAKREQRYTKKKQGWKVSRILDSMAYYNSLIEKDKSEAIKTFIGQNKNSILAPIAVERLDFLKHTSYIIDVYEHSKELFPYSSYVKNIGTKLARFKQLAVGQPAPEIILPNIDGENIKLSSLKGKHVLIYFSSSLVQKTMDEAKEIMPLYYQYNGKGFEVYNVAVEERNDEWKSYLESTDVPWITVSDVMGQNSTVFDNYMAPEFPMTYLIDDKGIIVSKFITVESLKEELRKRL